MSAAKAAAAVERSKGISFTSLILPETPPVPTLAADFGLDEYALLLNEDGMRLKLGSGETERRVQIGKMWERQHLCAVQTKAGIQSE
jgi:hypothetical protein